MDSEPPFVLETAPPEPLSKVMETLGPDSDTPSASAPVAPKVRSNCTSCLKTIPEGSEACPHCGKRLAEDGRELTLECPDCLRKNPTGAARCDFCGLTFPMEAGPDVGASAWVSYFFAILGWRWRQASPLQRVGAGFYVLVVLAVASATVFTRLHEEFWAVLANAVALFCGVVAIASFYFGRKAS